MQTKSLDMRGKYLSLIFTGWLISAAVNASEDHNWSYSGESGPANWAALEKNSSCGGSAQSPVNIIAANAQPDANRNRPLALDYRQRTLINNVINNGHSIQFDFAAGDALAYQGRRFDLMQIHFHSPSEHTLNGIRYPVELHLVHINKAEAEYTVLAFFGFEGRSLNIKAIEQNIPAQTGESLNIGKAIGFSKLFPRHSHRARVLTHCEQTISSTVFHWPLTQQLKTRARDDNQKRLSASKLSYLDDSKITAARVIARIHHCPIQAPTAPRKVNLLVAIGGVTNS